MKVLNLSIWMNFSMFRKDVLKKGILGITMLFLMTSGLNAQIVYTDITDGVPAGIDFDADGTDEFEISPGINGEAGAYLMYWNGGPQSNIHAVGTPPPGGSNWDVPSFVNAGFTIDANANWSGQGDCNINGFATPNPTIVVGQDRYLAMRIDINNTVYYGWVRVSVDASGNVTYKDYAYNATANTPIDAGAMSSAVLVTGITAQGQGNATTVISGNTLTIEATVLPANATNSGVTWSVTNGTGTATINPTTGVLTGGNVGTVTVTALAADGSGVSDDVVITVMPNIVLVTGITVQGQGNASTIVSGNTLTMEATVLPANATNSGVTWSVTNGTGAATIDANTGVLTAGNAGTVTVTALAADGSGISGDAVITITQATSISKLEQQDVQLFPNPAKKQVYLKTPVNGGYQIYNLQGMMVQEGVVLERTETLSLNALPQGVYVVRLTLENLPEMSQTLIVE